MWFLAPRLRRLQPGHAPRDRDRRAIPVPARSPSSDAGSLPGSPVRPMSATAHQRPQQDVPRRPDYPRDATDRAPFKGRSAWNSSSEDAPRPATGKRPPKPKAGPRQRADGTLATRSTGARSDRSRNFRNDRSDRDTTERPERPARPSGATSPRGPARPSAPARPAGPSGSRGPSHPRGGPRPPRKPR
jgi:hypothetical protein